MYLRLLLSLCVLCTLLACSAPDDPAVGVDAGTFDASTTDDVGEPPEDSGRDGDDVDEDIGATDDMTVPQTAWPLDEPGHHVLTVMHDDLAREVRLAVPETEVTGTVLLLHGSGQTAEDFVRKRRAFIALAHAEGWLVVAPLATVRGSKTSWNYSLELDSTRDTDFLLGVMEQLDEQSVPGPRYVAGFSNGGRMTHSLLAQRPDRFTAGAIVASNLGTEVPDGVDRLVPDATGARPVWMANGSADPSIPFDGGTTEAGTAKSVQDAIDFWTAANNCSGMPMRNDFAGGYRQAWTMCADGTEVVQVAYQSQEHAWPESGDVAGWDANPEIRDFFLRHP